MSTPAVIVEGLSVTLGGTEVLRDVSFECREGEFLAVVGKSGVGKTTLLNAVAGFVPHAGRIVKPDAIGYVFQDHALFPWMTVEKNVAFGLEGVPPIERRRRVAEMLNRVGLTDFSRKYSYELSGGQMQRVALARTLAPNPALILMDEPYAALDHHTRDAMQEWLLSIWQTDRKTILFVTHYVEEAIYLADRILVLEQGRFASDFPVPFPRPRSKEMRFTPEFIAAKHNVLACMSNGVAGSTAVRGKAAS
jgi:ABC-type nitrate/sulfonate/bicarbonate transport system ATPase subunit